jgi:hypothetical protein
MKVVQLVKGLNFHVEWHLKFSVEIGRNLINRQQLLFTEAW